MLTTTQHSALGDLHRFGRLHPPGPHERIERGTSHGFSRRTLQALVDAGYARWKWDTQNPTIPAHIIPTRPLERNEA